MTFQNGRPSREMHPVELVDEAGLAIGESTVEVAHRSPGLLHRAFSVLLVDVAGRILLQQRAACKTRFAKRWANACCGHPLPNEALTVAANRRLAEELGAPPITLTEVGIHLYRAEDPVTGRVEFEYDHVLLGGLSADEPLMVDPTEVADLRWVVPTALRADLVANPDRYAPWLAGVVGKFATATAAAPTRDSAAERLGGR